MKRLIPLIALSVIALHHLSGSPTDEAIRSALDKLGQEAAPDAHLAALHRLATSLDPRIPGACLPMLESPGESVRRNAARAIGSRWWQIAGEQIPAYVSALKACRGSEDSAVQRMCDRGIGLLGRSHEGAMFSRSRNRRWVIYERHGNPCLIDTRNSTEELLGPTEGFYFLPALQNSPVQDHCHWHPKLEMAALEIAILRRTREIWVWRHPEGLRTIGHERIAGLLESAEGKVHPESGFHTDFKGWSGQRLELVAWHTLELDGRLEERRAEIFWDPSDDSLKLTASGSASQRTEANPLKRR